MAAKGTKNGARAKGAERRGAERFDVSDMKVDLQSDEAFLFAYVENISELGIFVAAPRPLPLGSKLTLKFPARGAIAAIALSGIVRWINPPSGRHPGMGIAFEALTPAQREHVVALVRAVAYLTRN